MKISKKKKLAFFQKSSGGGKTRLGKRITALGLPVMMILTTVNPVFAVNVDVSTNYGTAQVIDGRNGWNSTDGDNYLISETPVTVNFVNHPFTRATGTHDNWDNFVIETVASDSAKGFSFRADAYGWEYGDNGITPTYTASYSWASWEEFQEICEANTDVSITAQKTSGTDVTFDIAFGTAATETYVLTYSDGVPSDLRFHLGADGAWIEITSVVYGEAGAVIPAHVTVHDPSIIKDPGGTYYIFGSHLAWAKSDDLIHWTTFENNINKDYDTMFAEEAAWCRKADSNYQLWPEGSATNMWAPDVIWNSDMNKWCMYMSINGPKWNSTICLLTADTLDGDWTYVGPVIQSGMTMGYGVTFDYTKVTGESTVNSRYTSAIRNNNPTYEPHAIDACVTYDDAGNLWMSYGSWSGGISMIRLDKTTGLRDYNTTYEYVSGVTDPYTGYRLAGGNQVSGEASYIEKIQDYYYLYVTYGGFSATGGYNMRVFRSKDITGPYLDYLGHDARYPLNSGDPGTTLAGTVNGNVGNRLMSAYQWSYMSTGYVAQGHNSSFVDNDGKSYVIYHTRFNDGTEGHQVRVHQLFVNEDGWLVTAPFEYTGETLTSSVTTADVVGDYEVLFHKLNIDYVNLEVVTGENITLNADGTITGERTGTWEFSSKGTPYVTIKIGSDTYKGVFIQQQMEDSTDTTWAVTLLGDNGVNVWGYRYVGEAEELAQKAADNLNMPQGAFTDITLPAKGINNSTITWTSSNENILAADGTVTIPDTDTIVTLTGTFTVRGASITKEYPITVYSPQSDTENKVLAKYYTNQEVNLTSAKEGSHRFANPFYEETTVGLQMYNGVSIKFDLKATSGADQWLKDIISFNAGSAGGLFFEGNSYLGYNGSGGIFDANFKNGSFSDQSWNWGTNYLGDSASVEIQILPTGFAVYVNDDLVYDQDDIEPYVSGKTDYTVPGQIAIDSYANVLDYLQTSATYMNFGWGSFWADGYNGTISNVVVSALPIEVVDTTGYLYYENFTRLAGKTGAATGWISGNAQSSLSVKLSNDENKYYLNFAVGSDSGNRGAYALFAEEARVSGEYTIELDTALTAGTNTQRSVSGFAILGTDANNYTADAEVTSGYILKLRNEPPQGTAVNQDNRTLQDQWYINNSDSAITIPVGTWIHIKADVNADEGSASVTITNRETGKVLYEGDVTINGSGTLGGLWLLRGRGVGTASLDNIAVHIHDWDTGEVTKPETCTEEGEKTYTCSVCGETKTEEIEKLEHTEGAPVRENEKAAECEVEGSYDEVIYCVVCDEELSRVEKTTPALEHIPGDPEETERIEPTQEEDGYYIEVVKCTLCDKELSSSKVILPALKHNWDEGTITLEPTCTEKGVKTHYCTDEDCEAVWEEPIAALDHDWDNGTVTQQPTCTAEGVKTYSCSRCEETKTEPVAILAHQPGEAQKENEVPATCLEDGRYEEVIRCEIGGEIISKEIKYTKALGHEWDDGTITKAPTCTDAGELTYRCTHTGCEETKTETIAALGHEWDDGTVTKAPTCTEAGELTYKCTHTGCVETKTETIAALGHEWDDGTVTKTPTCTDAGELTYRCTHTGCEETKTETIAALDHDWDDGTVTKAPTCTEDGVRTFRCSRCEETKTEAIAALNHDWQITSQQAATCEEDGWIEYTCANCGDTKRDTIPATGHSYGAPKFEWSGDDFATAEFICTACGNVQIIVATMEHTTKDGVTIYTATVEMEGQTYTSKKQIISLEEKEDMRIVIADEFEEIPDTLEEVGITSEQNIEEILKQTIIDNGYTDEKGYVDDNFVLHDILLQVLDTDGTSWKTVTAEDFPKAGLTITIPYPEGTDRINYDFVVTHMLTIEMNGYKPGDVEILDVTKTDAGLEFTVTSLSPIAVSWTKLNNAEIPGDTETPDNTDTPDNTQTPDDVNTPDDKKDSSEAPSDNTLTVNTGDEAHIIRLLLCGAVSIAVLLAAAVSNRKKVKH